MLSRTPILPCTIKCPRPPQDLPPLLRPVEKSVVVYFDCPVYACLGPLITMGFYFRGKTSERPVVVNEDEAVSSGVDRRGNPEADLKKFRKLHAFDPYLDISKLYDVDDVLATGDLEKEAAVEEQLLAEDSPYPEVRASVSRI